MTIRATEALPVLVRLAITGGRPAVLAAALALSAPGEYRLARLAGWDWRFALIMPAVLSLYAAVAAAIAGSLPKGTAERKQANAGALIALMLALAAQVVSHLIEAGYMTKSPGVVIAVSAVPPAVAAHVLHLTAAVSRLTPKAAMAVEPVSVSEPAAQESLDAEDPEVLQEPVHTPVDEPEVTEEPEPVTEPEKPQEPLTQREQIDVVVRDLYDALGNRRPATRHMTDALEKAGLPSSDGTARESRKRVEANEPHLKTLPSALAA
ncbi:hypothetical protein PV733_28205 [Streptomyces europaeiscabiei]|uniref:hypothetical protein n=1 Tax=Streptomyces europaeiscabiei TaxID=146819 RepID=UPI0029BA1444|nr:hypothetical protein [Streptomyces europaeiscabiei]MDX3712754.1 hypothetical protein [Streptomyces europaeiscabiei]